MTTHKISIHLDEPLHRGETLNLIIDTSNDLKVLAHSLVSDQRDSLEFPDVRITVDSKPAQAELTSQQAADRLGVSRPWLTARLKPHRTVGNRRRYRTEDVDAFGNTLKETT